MVADTARAETDFPGIRPVEYRQAVSRALQKTTENAVSTRWSSALGAAPSFELSQREGMIREIRSCRSAASPTETFQAFASLGGKTGWLFWNWAWSLRGLLDRLVGGPGLRRGRRHPTEIEPGDAIDFWRVEKVEPPQLLRLRAEMKVPGRAWLQWETVPNGSGTQLVQTAIFEPIGLAGHLYWNLLYPIHKLIFSGMVHAIATRAEAGLER